jgi:Uncharacterised nucleotidyltransferase
MGSQADRQVAAVARKLAIDALAARTIAALRDAGVPALLLKGASFARWLYGPDELRTYLDCDLLVAPSTFARAEAVLENSGLSRHEARSTPGRHHAVWREPRKGLVVELHHTLVGASAGPSEVWAVLSEKTDVITLAGRRVDVLSVPARALHAALHAAQHGGNQARSLEDLSRAVRRVSHDEWRAAAALAERIGAVPALSAGLRMDDAGADLAARLELSGEAPTDVRLRASGAPHLSLGFEWVASEERLGRRVRFVLSKAFPSRAFMRDWMPTVGRARLPLVVAYLWRLGWLAKRTPEAYRAWRAATKESSGPP